MLCGNYILSNRSEWTFYFLSSVQFNFTIGESIFLKILWLICYLITAYFTFSGKMMPAMYWMAGTMLAEAIVSFVYCLIDKKKA